MGACGTGRGAGRGGGTSCTTGGSNTGSSGFPRCRRSKIQQAKPRTARPASAMDQRGNPRLSSAGTAAGADVAGISSVGEELVGKGDALTAGATMGATLASSRTFAPAAGSAAGRVARGAGLPAAGEAEGEGEGTGVIDGAGVGVTAGVVATRGGGASGTTGPCAAGVCVVDGGNCHEPASCACAPQPSARLAPAASQETVRHAEIWNPVLNVMAGQGRSAV